MHPIYSDSFISYILMSHCEKIIPPLPVSNTRNANLSIFSHFPQIVNQRINITKAIMKRVVVANEIVHLNKS